jgi:ribonucleoside-triphosphate reductase
MYIPIKVDRDFELHMDTMRSKYGEDFEYLNGFHESQINFSDFIDGFIDKNVADVTIDANANVSSKDIRSLLNEKGKSHDKLFAFSKIFYELKKKYGLKTSREWLETEYNGGFYLHDASTSSYIPYCYAYDLTRLATEGLFFINNYNNQPPKHLTTFTDDVIEFISYMSNRSSGAVGIPNVLIWTYYFWKKDCEEGYYIKSPEYHLRQAFQKFVYRLNQPFMRVDQSSFLNMSIFDRYYLESLFGGMVYPDGTFVIDEIDGLIEHQKVFMEVVSEIRSENMFTFPVLTYSLLKRENITPEEATTMLMTKNYDVFVDKEFARWCSDHNVTWNDSNFFMSSDVGTLSNCCRLLSNTKKLNAFINSIGGTALSIGSIKVNTINLMRIFLEADGDWHKYFEILRERTLLCCKTLDVIRHIITRNIEKGLLPNYQPGGIEMDKQYCTIGILGLYEVIEAFGFTTKDEFGYVSYTDEGIKFASLVFQYINEIKDGFTDKYSFNVESVPAERAAVILCQKDKKLYEDLDKVIYSNQWIPLSEKCTINEKLRLSSILDEKCSGGSIAHINLESNFPSNDAAWDMLNKIALSGVIYFAFNTRINECKNHHGFVGTNRCPVCGEPVFDTYQRIVGYLVPTRSYSKERFAEFNTRQWYNYAQELTE